MVLKMITPQADSPVAGSVVAGRVAAAEILTAAAVSALVAVETLMAATSISKWTCNRPPQRRLIQPSRQDCRLAVQQNNKPTNL